MADNDLRICPACRVGFMEDSSRQTDPDICPNCGAQVSDFLPADDEGFEEDAFI